MARIKLPPKRGGRSAYSSFQVINPGKGLNNLISDSLIDDQESSDLENIQFVESGCPAKAPGFTQVGNTLSNNPRGMGYYTDTNSNKYLLTVDGTSLKYLNSSTWTAIAGASFDSSGQINMTQAQGSMFIWDSVNSGRQLSGLTLTAPTTTPSAKFSIYYGGYHIAAGTGSQVNRIYISVSTDPADFTNGSGELSTSTGVPGTTAWAGTGANYVDINKDDGDRITAFAKFREVLIIFKEKSIFQLTFDSIGVPIVQGVTKNYGCVSHRAVDNVDNDVFFLSRNGIYVLGDEANYANVIRTNELSARVHPIIEAINENQYIRASGIFYGYTYYLGVPTGSNTSNDTTITYDKRFRAFSRWTHLMPEAFTTYINSSNEEELIFTSANSAKVYKLTPSTYTADNSAISSRWVSKSHDLGQFGEYKRWIDCTIYFRQLSGIINIEILTDGGNVIKSASVSGLTARGGIGSYMFGQPFFGGQIQNVTSSTASATNNVPYRLRIGTKARSIKLRITNSRNNENFVVLGYAFTFRKYSHFVYPSSLRIQ